MEITTITAVKQKMQTLSDYARRYLDLGMLDKINYKISSLDDPLYIMIVGDGKRGKSTLINALLDQPVAETGVVPKTWKIDVFCKAHDSQYAELVYVVDGSASVKRTSFDEAKIILKEEENTLKAKKRNKEDWRSDIRDVKWYIESDWLSEKIALVDTPGFSQLRADTSIETQSIFNAKGIQLARQDGFSEYYYRSDVVLWCIDSQKLQDAEAKDKLKEFSLANKQIIGILTKMDRVEKHRWEEIRQAAMMEFSEYINEFLFSACGDDFKLQLNTIGEIRKRLKILVHDNEDNLKVKEGIRFLQETWLIIHNELSNIACMYTNNYLVYRSTLASILEASTNQCKRFVDETARQLDAVRNKVLRKIPDIYDISDGDAALFKIKVERLVKENVSNADIQRKTIQHFHQLGQLVHSIADSAKWEMIIIGKKSSLIMKIRETPNMQMVNVASSSFSLSLDTSHIDVGINVGFVSGAIGALAFGPIGLLAAGIGFLVGAAMKKSNFISNAEGETNKLLDKLEKSIAVQIREGTNSVIRYCQHSLDQSYVDINGIDSTEIIKHLFNIEHDMYYLAESLGCQLPGRDSMRYIFTETNSDNRQPQYEVILAKHLPRVYLSDSEMIKKESDIIVKALIKWIELAQELFSKSPESEKYRILFSKLNAIRENRQLHQDVLPFKLSISRIWEEKLSELYKDNAVFLLINSIFDKSRIEKIAFEETEKFIAKADAWTKESENADGVTIYQLTQLGLHDQLSGRILPDFESFLASVQNITVPLTPFSNVSSSQAIRLVRDNAEKVFDYIIRAFISSFTTANSGEQNGNSKFKGKYALDKEHHRKYCTISAILFALTIISLFLILHTSWWLILVLLMVVLANIFIYHFVCQKKIEHTKQKLIQCIITESAEFRGKLHKDISG